MDLGLRGRKAIVCASSRGLGRGCATALAAEGVEVVVNGRDAAYLEQVAEEIRQATGATVIAVAADVGAREGQEALLAACPEPDILVNNNAGPPFRDFRELDREKLLAGVTSNFVTPIEMIQRVIDGMVARKFGRIVNITSSSVMAPIGGLDLSSGARAGLTAFLKGVSQSVAGSNVTINNLLPGSFDTDRLRSGQERSAKARNVSVDTVRAENAAKIPAGRFGTPRNSASSARSSVQCRPATSPARTCSSTVAPSLVPSRARDALGWSDQIGEMSRRCRAAEYRRACPPHRVGEGRNPSWDASTLTAGPKDLRMDPGLRRGDIVAVASPWRCFQQEATAGV